MNYKLKSINLHIFMSQCEENRNLQNGFKIAPLDVYIAIKIKIKMINKNDNDTNKSIITYYGTIHAIQLYLQVLLRQW